MPPFLRPRHSDATPRSAFLHPSTEDPFFSSISVKHRFLRSKNVIILISSLLLHGFLHDAPSPFFRAFCRWMQESACGSKTVLIAGHCCGAPRKRLGSKSCRSAAAKVQTMKVRRLQAEYTQYNRELHLLGARAPEHCPLCRQAHQAALDVVLHSLVAQIPVIGALWYGTKT